MGKRKEYNKDYFKKWNRGMAYVLGFLCADGNIVKTARGTHFLAFYSKDLELIEYIKSEMNSRHKISARKSLTGEVYRIQIGSREYFDDLAHLGIHPNKVARMEVPKVPKKFEHDFIRGYFDGDGHVWHGANNVSRKKPSYAMQAVFTSASEPFLRKLLLILNSRGCASGTVRKSRSGEYARLQLSTKDALKLYGIMYNDRHAFCLRRKRVVFEKYIKMRV